MPTMDPMVKRFMSRKKKPPRRNFGTTGAIPGFGSYQEETIARKIAQAKARNDVTTTSADRTQRAPYRKGERFKRKHPYRHQRGDAARAHRPQVN